MLMRALIHSSRDGTFFELLATKHKVSYIILNATLFVHQ